MKLLDQTTELVVITYAAIVQKNCSSPQAIC